MLKLPDSVMNMFGKKQNVREFYFSLIPDSDSVSAAAWYIDQDKIPHVAAVASAPVTVDSWDERIKIIDRLLSTVEDKAKVEKAITKTVFGMPGMYLTHDGNIAAGIRPHLKKLSTLLELAPVGFVPIAQAYAYFLKSQEGIPTSAIFLNCSGQSIAITLYRVGTIVSEHMISGEDLVVQLEDYLKKHQESEVLPSRMLLLGNNHDNLNQIRAKLLKHPWPTRTNFLHFPKIEIVTLDDTLEAISLAGASELANEIGGDEESQTIFAQPVAHVSEEPIASVVSDEELAADVPEPPQEIEEEVVLEPEVPQEEIANVEMVTPETLGFRPGDVLDVGSKSEHHGETHEKKKFVFPSIDTIRTRLPKIGLGKGAVVLVILFVIFMLGYSIYYFIPRATVTAFVLPKSFEESNVFVLGLEGEDADGAGVILGKKIEKTVSGEKTIAVTGKKKVGDPARGTITLYNKVTSERTLAKGTTVNAKGLSFTLDASVTIASASESIGSITFGHADVAVTAAAIGPEGNLSKDAEFSIKDVSTSSLSGRNEAVFAGGTSKEITVVTRADYDGLTKSLTEQLVTQAQSELQTDTGSQHIIEETIKTQVTDKTFDNELDEETKQLHGAITVTISGTAYDDNDIKTVLVDGIKAKVPSGYVLDETQMSLSPPKLTVKKDGTVSIATTLSAVSIPTFDQSAIQSTLAGKKIDEAITLLKQMPGVASAEFHFALSPTTRRLPLNKKNITFTVAVQQ